MTCTEEERVAYQTAYRKKHKRHIPDSQRDYHREYYNKNRAELLENQKKYAENNKEKYRLYHRNRRLGRRMIIDRYKTFCGCAHCGYRSSAVALDLHHKEESQKEYRVSRMTSFSMDRLRAEIRKCVVLCSNCHRELHEGLWDLEDVL